MPQERCEVVEDTALWAVILGMSSQIVTVVSHLNPRKKFRMWCYLAGLVAFLIALIRILFGILNAFEHPSWPYVDGVLSILFLPVWAITFDLTVQRCNAFLDLPKIYVDLSKVYNVIIICLRLAMSGMEMYLTDQDIAMSKIEQHFEGSEDGMPANVQEEFDANAHRLGRLDIHMTNVREAGRQLYVWGILIINLAFAASIVSHLHAILRNLPSTRNKSIWKAISRLGDIFVSLLIEFLVLGYVIADAVHDVNDALADAQGREEDESTSYINISGITELMTVAVLCNIFRFGVSVKDIFGKRLQSPTTTSQAAGTTATGKPTESDVRRPSQKSRALGQV